MKKLFTMMLIWATVACLAQQNKTLETMNKGFIQMRINVLEENHHFYDNNTIVVIDCISDNLLFSDTSSNFTFVLHPNKEYVLTFKRYGCIDKSIVVSTYGINIYGKYTINTIINMKKGIINSTEPYGRLVYNTKKDSFDQQIVNNY